MHQALLRSSPRCLSSVVDAIRASIAPASPIAFAAEGSSYARLGRLCRGQSCRAWHCAVQLVLEAPLGGRSVSVCPVRSVSALSLWDLVCLCTLAAPPPPTPCLPALYELTHRCVLEVALTRRRSEPRTLRRRRDQRFRRQLSSDSEPHTQKRRARIASESSRASATRGESAPSQPWARKRRDASN